MNNIPKKLKPTIECTICGSILIGSEPRIRTICHECKDVRHAPLGAMSPFEPTRRHNDTID
jgi:hypothetical protein